MTSHSLSPAASSFIFLAEKGKFVDKTSALVEFLDSDDHPVHLLVRPRRSGKTTLLRLFRAFFERKDPADQEERRKLFENNQLAITKDVRFETEFARYPVLYVDFSNMSGSTMDQLLQDFKNHVSVIAQQLETSGKFNNRGELGNSEQLFLDNVLRKTLDDSEWPTVLFRLTTLLNTLSKRLVVVLVDEFDTPTSCAVHHGYFDDANNFFRKVFSPLLKNNESIRGALVVGILPIAKAGWFSGVNNLRVFRLDSEQYSTACMFTEDETRRLYNQEVALRGDSNLLPFSFEELKGWYSGYYTFDDIRLYNPWSIASALSTGKLRPYWVESGYDQIIEQRIYYMLDNNASFRKQVAGLSGEGVEIEIEPEMSYHSIPEMTKTRLWTLIYFAGYLTKLPQDHKPRPVDAPDHDSDTESQTYQDNDSTDDNDVPIDDDSSRDMIELCLPNYEIRSIFDRWLRIHMKNRISAQKRQQSSRTLFHLAVQGSIDQFSKQFGSFLLDTMPAQFLGNREVVYQAYVSAFLTATAQAMSVTPKWDVDVERCSGLGRLDLVIQRPTEKYGAIQEYKRIELTKKDRRDGYGDSQGRRLTKHADDALKQIETRLYRAQMLPTVTELREYGIAFLGPYCAVTGRLLERKPGEGWIVKEIYTSKMDEKRRLEFYRAG